MASKLYVGGLPYSYGENELKGLFEDIGEVTSAIVIKDKFTDRSKGFGFVEFASKEDADSAVNKLNGSELEGRKITVDHARPPREDNDRGGFNRR